MRIRMKHKFLRSIAVLLLLSLLCNTFLSTSTETAYANTNDASYIWPTGPSLDAASAVLIEANTGLVLFEKNAHETHYPASTTKLMTTLLALENAQLNETVTCSYDSVYEIEFNSSRIWVDVGEELIMQDALYAVLLASANDVSYAVAEHVGGTYENFIQMMNDRAAELGCKNTHFMNPHGLDDPNHYTTAYDLALIARAAVQYPVFNQISGSRNYEMPTTNLCDETRWISNTHRFIKKSDSRYLYDGVFAGKTGYTDIARTTLVTCAKRNGLTLICVLMKVSTGDQAYVDAANLLNFGFNNFSCYDITAEDAAVETNFPALFDGQETVLSEEESMLVRVDNGKLILPVTASYEDATRHVTLSPLTEFVEGENVIGQITYTYGDRDVGIANILYDYKKPNMISQITLSPMEGTPGQTLGPATEQTDKTDWRPVMIGVITAVVVLAIGFYIIFVELPYRRKRAAYLARRKRERERF